MRAEEIKDAESLQAWLESLPQEAEEQRETARRWAVTIAHRAAMRVLPVFVDSILFGLQADGQDEVLKAFRALLISSLAPKTGSRAVYRAASGVPFEGDPVAGRFAAKAAAQQACKAISSQLLLEPVNQSIEYSSYVLEEELLGLTLALDAQRLMEANVLESFPLWPPTDEVEAFGPEENGDLIVWYESAKQPLLDFDQGWRFWVEWYENALNGRPQDYDLLTKIALIDPADWDKGADHVNALIPQIRLEHIAETRPLGEDAIDIGPDGLWHRTGNSDIDGDILQDAVESVQDEIANLRSKLQGPQGNMFTALVSDLDLLEQRIARHPGRPLRLHDVFIRVQGHIAHNLQSGELPDDDGVRDLSSVLGNAALDMCNACDKTKSVVQKRMAVRFDEADEQTRDDLKLIAEGAAKISDAELGSEFIEDAEVISDEAIPLSEKTPTLYRLQTRLARIVSKDGKNLVDALCLIGAMGSGVGVLAWITMTLLRFIIGP